MSIIAATVSSSGRISVGPKQTPMFDTDIRFFLLYSDTLKHTSRRVSMQDYYYLNDNNISFTSKYVPM